jgi:hypothetical protein
MRRHHMRRTVLAAFTIFALTSSGFGQSEQMTIKQISREQLPRLGNRTLFVHTPTTNSTECASISSNAITPQVAPRLGRTILAEALVYSKSTVGYVFLISYQHGPYEVYLASYTQRACALTESQSHSRVFAGDNPFNEAKAYYHELFNELSE